MPKAYIDGSFLHLEYHYFSPERFSGVDAHEVIKLDEMGGLVSLIGPRGGDKGWYIVSKEKGDYSHSHSSDEEYGYKQTHKHLFSGGERLGQLYCQVEKILEERGISSIEYHAKSIKRHEKNSIISSW